MNWRQNVSNWLSQGSLEQSQKQAKTTEAKFQQQQSVLEELQTRLQQSQTEIQRLQAQLQISKGFQIELGQTQIELKATKSQLQSLQQDVRDRQKKSEDLTARYEQAQAKLSESQDWLSQVQAPFKVVAVTKLLPKQEFDALWGFGLGSPQADTQIVGGAVAIKGWVLGRKAPISKVQVAVGETVAIESPIGQARPKITQQYPDIPGAGNCGFECCLSLIGMPKKVDLVVRAVAESGKTIALCSISVERE